MDPTLRTPGQAEQGRTEPRVLLHTSTRGRRYAPCQASSGAAEGGGGQTREGADGAADDAGEEVGGRGEERQRDQDRGGNRDADRVVLLADRAARLLAADHEPGAEGAERHPVAAGDEGDRVVARSGGAGEGAERPAGEQQDQRRQRSEAPLDAGREDRQRHRDDEEEADVDIGEGRCEVAPPVFLEGDDDAAEAAQRIPGRLLDQQQDRRGEDDPDRRVGPLAGDLEPGAAGPRQAAPATARLLRLQGVAASLQLRRPLAQPGPAVGALGYVGTDLRAAVLADDAELSLAHVPRIPAAARLPVGMRDTGSDNDLSRRNLTWS